MGKLVDKKKSKIDPYIPMKQPGSLICGPFSIQNAGIVTTAQKDYTTYLVSVRRGPETRDVRIFEFF